MLSPLLLSTVATCAPRRRCHLFVGAAARTSQQASRCAPALMRRAAAAALLGRAAAAPDSPSRVNTAGALPHSDQPGRREELELQPDRRQLDHPRCAPWCRMPSSADAWAFFRLTSLRSGVVSCPLRHSHICSTRLPPAAAAAMPYNADVWALMTTLPTDLMTPVATATVGPAGRCSWMPEGVGLAALAAAGIGTAGRVCALPPAHRTDHGAVDSIRLPPAAWL